MAHTGYLGGNISCGERQKLVQKYLAPKQPTDLGLDHQCRCGGSQYVFWRKRWYCHRCGRWFTDEVRQKRGGLAQ